MLSLPSPPLTVVTMSAARLPVPLKLSSPPSMFSVRFSVVPMSIAMAPTSRSSLTRVPLAVSAKISLAFEPLNTSVSVPLPPSMTSLPSPGFQISVSLSSPPSSMSLVLPLVMVSLPAPPDQRRRLP